MAALIVGLLFFLVFILYIVVCLELPEDEWGFRDPIWLVGLKLWGGTVLFVVLALLWDYWFATVPV